MGHPPLDESTKYILKEAAIVITNLWQPSPGSFPLSDQGGDNLKATALEVITSLLRWNPTPNKSKCRKLSFPDAIARDTVIKRGKLGMAMLNRVFWREEVESIISIAVRV